jgi:hypothetical protein
MPTIRADGVSLAVQPIVRTLAEYSEAMGTSDNVKSQVIIEPRGDIVALSFRLTQSTSGSLSGARTIDNAIKSISLVDREGKPIFDIKGTDLPKLDFWTNGVGSYNPAPVTSATPQTRTWVLAIGVKLQDQPAKLQVVFAPYSDMASSGATGGNVALRIDVWYGVATHTTRVYKREKALSVGDNALGVELVDGKNLIGLFLEFVNESNINHITFSADGSIDNRAKQILAQLAELERIVYRSGHITNLYNLFVAPFRTDITKTKLTINASSATSVVIWHIATN